MYSAILTHVTPADACSSPRPSAGEPSFRLDVPVLADADALAEVHNQVWREAYAGIVPQAAFDDAALERRRSMWHRILGTWDADLLHERIRIGRRPGGAPLGFLMIGPALDEDAPRSVQLQTLNVVASSHGSGLAQALVADLLGDRPAYLWVVEDNPRARRFYEKVGFAADGGVTVDASLGDLREIRMSR